MRVGIIGTGAIAQKHAQVYANIGYEIAACANRVADDEHAARGRDFAARYHTTFMGNWQDLCADPAIDFVDVCTLPFFRLPVIELCAVHGKHLQVEKPIAIDLDTARRMVERAKQASIRLGVVSQHRFDDASRFLKSALSNGRLGKILEADAYVKWFRPAEYYSRPVKGAWQFEGGGALINQGIHSVDLLLWMMGPVEVVRAEWRLGALRNIESEDMVNAMVRYESGALGVIQAATAFRPGSPERIEIHGTKGTAILTGDRLTTWDVENDVEDDSPEAPPIHHAGASGASDPMAISLTPFERQFLDFGDAIAEGRAPLVSGMEGYRALEVVEAIYRSCRNGQAVELIGAARA